MNILQQQPGIGGFQEQEITIHLSQTLSWPTLKLLFVDFKLDFENFRLGFDKQGPICIAKIPKKLCGEVTESL
jgi:hypothetical protein